MTMTALPTSRTSPALTDPIAASASVSGRWFIWAFAVATVILVAVGGNAYVSMESAADAYAWRGHTYETLVSLEELQSSLVDAETAERGYLLTGQDDYLEPYEHALQVVPITLATIHRLTGDNPEQQARLQALDPLIATKMRFVRSIVDARRQQGFDTAQRELLNGQGKSTMDGIRAIVSEMRMTEANLLEKRAIQADADAKGVAMLVICGDALALIVVVGTAFFMVRTLTALRGSLVAVHAQEWLQSHLAGLGDILREEQDAPVLGQRILDHLAAVLAAPVAALYQRGEDDGFALVAGYALAQPRLPLAGHGEALVGEAARTRRIIHLDHLPTGYLPIASALGSSPPRRLAVIPLISRDRVEGVLELGAFHDWNPRHLAFMARCGEGIATALATTRSLARIRELLRTSQQQEEELRMQQEELTSSNEELEEQARQLVQRNHEVEGVSRAIEMARRDLEEKAGQLALSSKYKSEFLSNMSHELRTPLNSLLILSQQLYENHSGNLNDKQVRYAQTINSSGRDLLTLINDLLDLSKIESGTVELDHAAIGFDEIRDAIERTMRPLAQQKGLRFAIRLGDDLPALLRTDHLRLQQVLKNLLSNAFKFTPVVATHPGSVTLTIAVAAAGWSPDQRRLAQSDTVIAFAVSDNGIGIPAGKQQIIFEAFQQADGSGSRKYGGTGLGLTISRQIAQLLGGELRLVSHEGEGSTFTLFLPLLPEEATPMPPPTVADTRPSLPTWEQALTLATAKSRESSPPSAAVAAAVSVKASGPSGEVEDDRGACQAGDRVVLIVEDDPAFARILVELAHEHDFKALVIMHGAAVFDLARERQPDAITLDIHLADSSGWHLLDRLKHDAATRHIPIHVITVDDVRDRALRQGAHGFITKPASRAALGRAFQSLVGFADGAPRRLLLIEDNEDERAAIVAAIVDADVEITTAGHSDTAIAALSVQHFDCIVLDLGLPGMSGQRLLETLHRHSAWSTIPVIIHTARDLTNQEGALLRRAAKTIVVKTGASLDRLLDETTLFLHRVHSRLPIAKWQRIERIHRTEASLAGRTLLVVDDDERNVFALTALLEHHGITVVAAANGQAALRCLEDNRGIDLVLMDLMMPEMDGHAAMRAIRAQSGWKTLTIIALTAKAMNGDRELCMASGASDYITKPVNSDQLLSMLRVWLYR